MKKFLALAALLVGITACQKEPEGLEVSMGGEVAVRIDVTVPEEQTRADYSDSRLGVFGNGVLGTKDDATTMRYILKIFDSQDPTKASSAEARYSDESRVTFDVNLVADRKYTFVVWADVVTEKDAEGKYIDNHYDTSEFPAVKLKGDWNAMDESRDAFTGKLTEVLFNYNTNLTLNLSRPFAKLRIVANDIEDVVGVGITPAVATVTYATPHRTSFNALTGAVGEANLVDKRHEYKFSEVEYENVATAESYTLLTDYFFAVTDDEVEFELNIFEDEAKTKLIKSNSFTSNIKVKPNALTSIKGDILTTGGNVNITTNPGSADSQTMAIVNTEEKLQQIIDNADDGEEIFVALSGDITLSGSIVLTSTRASEPSYSLLVPEGKSVVLDLNGYAIRQTKAQTTHYSMLQNDGTLTIIDSKGNGKLSYTDSGNGGEYVSNAVLNNGTLIVESGIVENLSNATVAANGYPHAIDNRGKLTIDGGEVNSASYSAVRIWCTTTAGTEVNIKGGRLIGSVDLHNVNGNANHGVLNIEGGVFTQNAFTNKVVRLVNFGEALDNLAINITGGTFNGIFGVSGQKKDVAWESVFNIVGGTYTTIDGMSENILAEGYAFEDNGDGTWGIVYTDAAKIGDTSHTTLADAFDAAKSGDSIVLQRNTTQSDGFIIADKNLTIDLNGNTFTVTEGASTNNRNFKVVGNSEVTIKNGTLVAKGELTSGAYGTIRTEGSAKVTLEGVKLYSYRGYGLNIKACSGSTIIVNNSEIYAEYSGGVEAAGGTIELNNTKIEQKGVYTGAAWCSVAIGVNGGGKVTVNSGDYSATTDLAQGTWTAYVMSSGGTLDIKGGTFNGTDTETAAAANACGIICADANAVVNIYGGSFTAKRAIIDIRNNTNSTNPLVTLYGGTYNCDPRVSGLYSSNLITFGEGLGVSKVNGTWSVVDVTVATIGTAKYTSLQGAFDAVKDNETIMLYKNIQSTETATFAAGKSATLDLNGHAINNSNTSNAINNRGNLIIKGGVINHTDVKSNSAAYAINNTGTLTIKDCTIISQGGALSSATTNGKAKMENTNVEMSGTSNTTSHTLYALNGGSIEVDGGIITNNTPNQHSANGSCVINGYVMVTSGTFFGYISCTVGALKGGTYNIEPAAGYLASGYRSVSNGDGTWSIVPIQ